MKPEPSSSRTRLTRPASPPSTPAAPFPAEEVWNLYPESQVAFPPFEIIRYSDIASFVQGFHRDHPGDSELSQFGSTAEGRTLWTLQLGRGSRRILVWCRQHGDEPLCTAALLNALNFLLSRSDHPVAQPILDNATLLVLPLINPDGVQRFTRRNSMGIDPNRDAQQVLTPEGAALLRARDAFRPEIAFNLHDMSPRKSTADEKRVVAMAFQAGPYDRSGGDNDVRRLAKRLCARMAEAAARYAHGHLTRYDAPFMPRAFGDSMMGWGVATVLIESGGWWEPDAHDYIARLHFLAFLAGLHAAAAGSEARANPAYYDSLPLDSGRPYFDIVLRDPWILDGSARPGYRAEIGINHDYDHRDVPHGPIRPFGSIADFGDMSEDCGKVEIDGRGLLCVPGLVALAPGLRLNTREDIASLVPFLEAGFTTVAGGCGPFPDAASFQSWRSTIQSVLLPTHFPAFEVVESLQDILDRHGQTDAYGLLVPGLSVSLTELLEMLHLYGASQPPIVSEEQESAALTLDLFFRPVGGLRSNRLHLFVRPEGWSGSKSQGVRGSADLLREVVRSFIGSPEQISLSIDPAHPLTDLVPAPPSLSGIAGEGEPSSTYLRDALRAAGQAGNEGLDVTVACLSRQTALGLGVQEAGLVQPGYRADLVLFECPAEPAGVREPAIQALGSPHTVIVNGVLAVSERRRTNRNGGLLVLR